MYNSKQTVYNSKKTADTTYKLERCERDHYAWKWEKLRSAGLGKILEIRIFYVKEFPIAGKAKKVSLLVEVPTF